MKKIKKTKKKKDNAIKNGTLIRWDQKLSNTTTSVPFYKSYFD
jgi:hypothetical protein